MHFLVERASRRVALTMSPVSSWTSFAAPSKGLRDLHKSATAFEAFAPFRAALRQHKIRHDSCLTQYQRPRIF
jgi:hypothetical protein